MNTAESNNTTSSAESNECTGFVCPYCGECTMEQFFSEAGCPRLKSQQKSTETKVLFPYLDTSGLDKADQTNLEYRLKSETKKMIISFARFKGDVIRSLEYWGVSLEKIKHSILSLEAFSHSIGVKLLDEKDKEIIKSAKTISDVFIVLCDYTSFVNYEIIEHIIDQHGATKDHENLEDYQKRFHTFCQRNIFEVPRGVFSSSSRKSAKMFALKCTEGVATMKSVLEVKGKIAEVFSLQPAALQLCSVKEGCVELRFLISAKVADIIFPVSSRQQSALDEIGARILSCDGVEQTLRKMKDPICRTPSVPHDTSGTSTTAADKRMSTGTTNFTTSVEKRRSVGATNLTGKIEERTSTETTKNRPRFYSWSKGEVHRGRVSSPLSYREFISQEVCPYLNSKEVRRLAYSQDLPPTYFNKDGIEVLSKLELSKKFSENNLEPLAQMLKVINRADLAAKVQEYYSNTKRQKQQRKASHIPDDKDVFKQYQMEARLKIAEFHANMLLEQIEEVHTTAQHLGLNRMEEELLDAISIIEQQLQSKLSQASVALSMASTESDQNSQLSSLTSSGKSKNRELVSQEVKTDTPGSQSDATSKHKGKNRSLPRSRPLPPQPILLAECEDEYEYVQVKQLSVPQNKQDESQGRLVVGRDGIIRAKQKPKIAPKPTKKLVSSANSPSSSPTVPAPIANYTGGSADYTGGSADTSAGDSGFVDARKFMKNSPPPRVPPRHIYTRLNTEQREATTHYDTATNTNTIKGVVYEIDDVAYAETRLYLTDTATNVNPN